MKRSLSIALACVLALLSACGDDDDTSTGSGSASAPEESPARGETDTDGSEDATAEKISVTVTADAIDIPEEIPGGVVEVTIDNQAGGEEIDVSFARVASGTSEDAFRTAILAAFEGESIDESIQAVSGVAGGSGSTTETIILEGGEYFVFSDAGSSDEEGGETTLLVAPTTVSDGEVGDLPEGDGTITAVDYGFEVDVQAGDAYTFRNDGPEQFHHAVVFGFGDIDPAVVEENIKAFLEGDGPEDAPEALAGIEGDPYVGGSSVFSPDLAGTFRAPLESGNTYAVVCFIGDRAGGPPHAFAHDMFEVFTVA